LYIARDKSLSKCLPNGESQRQYISLMLSDYTLNEAKPLVNASWHKDREECAYGIFV